MARGIRVAIDGHTTSERAVEYAFNLANQMDVSLEALYVVDTRLTEVLPRDEKSVLNELTAEGKRALEDIEHKADLTNIDLTTRLVEGYPPQAILSNLDSIGAIVIGRRATEPAEPHLIGSTAEQVISESTVPVLSVPPNAPDPETTGFKSVLVPTDGSPYPDKAAEIATEWADSGGRIHALYVIDSTIYNLSDSPRSIIGHLRKGGEQAVAAVAETATERGLKSSRHIRRGSVNETILTAIEDIQPSLLAMGTRGRSADGGPLLGSTTAEILRKSTVPIVTTR